jgi:hypothetical protein
MHSATTATGRPFLLPGKSLPKNRPAPLSCRASHQLATPKPHVTFQLQCYILSLIDNVRQSPRKINRQQIATSQITNCAVGIPDALVGRSSHNASVPQIATALLDTNGCFRRNNNSCNSFKTNDRVNSYSIQTATLAVKYTTARSVSNRQLQISEIAKNPTKTSLSGFLIDTKTQFQRLYINGWRDSKLMRRLSSGGRSPESRST